MSDGDIYLSKYLASELNLVNSIAVQCKLAFPHVSISARYRAGVAAVESLRAEEREREREQYQKGIKAND